MKTAKQLTEESFVSAEQFRLSATRLKRLASSLQNEATSFHHGLTENERDILVRASSLVRELATANKSAEAIAKKRAANRSALKKKILSETQATFAGLSEIKDQVALIGAVNISDLRLGFVQNMDDLRRCFAEALDTLTTRVAQASERPDAKSIGQIIAELWGSFLEKRPGLIEQHREIIAMIEQGRHPR